MLPPSLSWAAPLLAPAVHVLGADMTWAEVAGFVLSLWMVERNFRVHWAGWPLAIVSSLLYWLVFLDAGLYGEGSLQLFFVAVSAWGWWQWVRRGDAQAPSLVVHRLSRRAAWGTGLATAAAWPAVGAALFHWSHSAISWLDALPTAGSLAGQFLLGRKAMENWPVWLAVNVVSIALFAVKGLWLTVVLYALFAVLSLVGWRAWRGLEGARDAAHAG